MSNPAQQIANELDVVLPAPYRRLFECHPFPDSEGGVCELLADPRSIVDYNQELQSDGFFGSDWPNDFLAIGRGAADCVFFIRVNDPKAAVYYADFDEDFPPEEPLCDFQRFLSRLNHPDGFENDEGGIR